ncbi:MAG: L-seryl-tRNA(Sec) selenium transferase, partial [Chlamydiota bacterium]
MTDKSELYRRLPSVDELLHLSEIAKLVEREGHAAVTEGAREVLGRVREEIAAGHLTAEGVDLAV